ncbi:hypothetical protein CIHG_05351 [Coccidioides immitis H538.4]|uniref:Uncharacterized protein n=1 Tax=Coccidioides immitis H538.4 TaxID=396776 RepID=A0A0J8RSK9_COCIT|nr:hypothetical protein CIHG_05351 [Coccidioides immitis H538.4]
MEDLPLVLISSSYICADNLFADDPRLPPGIVSQRIRRCNGVSNARLSSEGASAGAPVGWRPHSLRVTSPSLHAYLEAIVLWASKTDSVDVYNRGEQCVLDSPPQYLILSPIEDGKMSSYFPTPTFPEITPYNRCL